MGVNKNHILPRRGILFAKKEATKLTIDNPFAAANAIRHIPAGTSFDVQVERQPVDEARLTRSTLEYTTGKRAVTWQTQHYLRPSGVAGTAPDYGDILECLLGSTANTPGTRQTYTIDDDGQSIKTLSLGILDDTIHSELIYGSFVNQGVLAGSGGDRPTWTFSGGAVDHVQTLTSTVDGSNGGGTSLDVADGGAFSVGSIIEIGSDTNTGAGYRVTAISGDTLTLHAAHGGFTGGEVVRPLQVTPTYAGSPLPGIAGTLAIGSLSVYVQSYNITFANNHIEHNTEALTAGMVDVVPDFLTVSGTFELRAYEDYMALIKSRRDFTNYATVLTIGDTAGKKVVLELDNVEFNFAAIGRANNDAANLTLPFNVLGQAAGQELTIKYE